MLAGQYADRLIICTTRCSQTSSRVFRAQEILESPASIPPSADLITHSPIRAAICGIGGYASSHHSALAELEREGLVRVTATCDPTLEHLAETCRTHDFAGRGVAAYSDFGQMLQAHGGELDLAVVATPIHCHAPMHEALVRRGIACYLEKPPTLDPGELDRMLAVEQSARMATHVGFHFIHLADRLGLRQRIAAGEFGQPVEFSFLGLTPRKPAYFLRNNWAGRLRVDGTLVLDSCLGNAMAHYLNNMLFWAGRARPLEMESELYRANPIEGCDTIFARGRLDNGATLRLAATHACDNPAAIGEERMVFRNATIVIKDSVNVSVTWKDGRKDEFAIEPPSLPKALRAYLDFLRGRTAQPAQTLEESRGFVEANALFYLAAQAIHPVGAPHLRQTSPEEPVAIDGIAAACRAMVNDGRFPSSGPMPWARPGGRAEVRDLADLESTVDRLATGSSAD